VGAKTEEYELGKERSQPRQIIIQSLTLRWAEQFDLQLGRFIIAIAKQRKKKKIRQFIRFQ
jgi:hypothetical protein